MMDPVRVVRRAAVLGAGVMGAQLAAQFANAGVLVDLFEVDRDRTDPRSSARRAIDGLSRLHPAPLATAGAIDAIAPASYEHDLDRLAHCDLVVEAVTERLDVKRELYGRVGTVLGQRTVFTTTTSGLSIAALAEALPREVRPRFCALHFFNPPRYMHLVEMVAHPGTDVSVLHRLEGFLTTGLGKGVLHARDTPGFIGNRVGMFALMTVMHHAQRLGLSFDLADRLSGPGIGRPRSATFRTVDVIGLDTFGHIVDHLHETLHDDPWREVFRRPEWLRDLEGAGALGQKSGAGIYRKGAEGIEVYQRSDGDYRPVARQIDPDVRDVLLEPDPARKYALLEAIDHPQAELLRASHRDLFHYCAYHLATIAPSAREVDLALRWGFAWQRGPFELWQLIGWQPVTAALQRAIDAGEMLANAPLPDWARESRRGGVHGPRGAWSADAATWLPRSNHPVYRRQLYPPRLAGEPLPSTHTIWENEAVRLWDADDEVAVLSLRGRRRAADAAVLDGVQGAIEAARAEARAMVLWQDEPPFCTGLDLRAIRDAQERDDYEALDSLVARSQQITAALRYGVVPVVGAPAGRALGTGAAFLLHCDLRVGAQEMVAGLVEAGVGLLPAGACAVLARRAFELAPDGDPLPWVQRYFDEIMRARTSGSGTEALGGPWFRPGDRVVFSTDELLHAAKSEALALSDAGYRPPLRGRRFPVAGAAGMGMLEDRLGQLQAEGSLTDHDHAIGRRLAEALCGGEVHAGTEVDDDCIEQLEREGFVALASTGATAARVAHMLDTGKRLRN